MARAFLTFFPQFCREEINDAAWYPGFTDWDLVRKVPADYRTRFVPAAGYYDLADRASISRELEAVASSPWPAMALYQYFFDGRFALDSVEKHIVERQSAVPPFFSIWANETWSKRWIGKPHDIIVRQRHSTERSVLEAHVDRLVSLFAHPSYHRENGRPVFVIYAAFEIPEVSRFVRAYREAFRQREVDPLIGFCVPYVDARFDAREFDFCVEFQPRLFFNVMRSRHRGQTAKAGLFLKRCAPRAFDQLTAWRDALRRGRDRPGFSFDYRDYLDLVEQDYFNKALEDVYQKPAHRSLFFSWNNFPRYRGSAVVVEHAPGDYEKFKWLCERYSAGDKWFLVNSWNEWSEGAALEQGCLSPDRYELRP